MNLDGYAARSVYRAAKAAGFVVLEDAVGGNYRRRGGDRSTVDPTSVLKSQVLGVQCAIGDLEDLIRSAAVQSYIAAPVNYEIEGFGGWKGRCERYFAADTENNGVAGTAALHTVSVGGIGDSIGVVDRFAQTAHPVTSRRVVEKRGDGYRIAGSQAARRPQNSHHRGCAGQTDQHKDSFQSDASRGSPRERGSDCREHAANSVR